MHDLFLFLVPNTVPFSRDPANFTDSLYQIFPPFAHCEISPSKLLINQNTHRFGCHLHFMEYYEKIFIILWFVLAFFWLWSAFVVVWLCFGLVPYFGKFFFALTAGFFTSNSVVSMLKTLHYSSLVDIHTLYLVKPWMSNVQFRQIMADFGQLRTQEIGRKFKGAPKVLLEIK